MPQVIWFRFEAHTDPAYLPSVELEGSKGDSARTSVEWLQMNLDECFLSRVSCWQKGFSVIGCPEIKLVEIAFLLP
ncbi:hypothetical protein PM082_011472 [Marasmius tenuissimus]|nr:hypothetical protein PM082_011472 [Marasmius tenuissimus]